MKKRNIGKEVLSGIKEILQPTGSIRLSLNISNKDARGLRISPPAVGLLLEEISASGKLITSIVLPEEIAKEVSKIYYTLLKRYIQDPSRFE